MNKNTRKIKNTHTIEEDTEGWEGDTATLGLQGRDSKKHARFRHKPVGTI